MLTECRVPEWASTDVSGNHLARVQADPKSQLNLITAGYLGGQILGLLLNAQCGQTTPQRVVLERDRCPEQRHDSVAGELVDGTAVPPHNGCRALKDRRHDLAKSLRAES